MVKKDVSDPYYTTRFKSTSEGLLIHHVDKERGYMVECGYSEQERFITIRPTAMAMISRNVTHPDHRFIAYLALTFYDRYLSRNNDIPVVMQGEGFEHNLQLFVAGCISIAYREALNMNEDDFVVTHRLVDQVKKMDSLVREGLEDRVELITALTPAPALISLLEMEEQQHEWLYFNVHEILFAIHEDINFTKFLLSTLAAAAILVACDELYPGQNHEFSKKILKSKFVKKAEVLGCFCELKDHRLVASVLKHMKDQTEKVTPVAQGKGKEPLIEDDPYEFEDDYEEHEYEDDYEEHEYTEEQETQEHTSGVNQEEEEHEQEEDASNQITEEQKDDEDTSEISKDEEHSSQITGEEEHEHHEDASEITKEDEENLEHESEITEHEENLESESTEDQPEPEPEPEPEPVDEEEELGRFMRQMFSM